VFVRRSDSATKSAASRAKRSSSVRFSSGISPSAAPRTMTTPNSSPPRDVSGSDTNGACSGCVGDPRSATTRTTSVGASRMRTAV
jgi:hypothetical protein